MKRQLVMGLALIMMASAASAAPKFVLREAEKDKRTAGDAKPGQTHVNESRVETTRMVEIGKIASSLGVSGTSLQAFSRPEMRFNIEVNEAVAKGQPKSSRQEQVTGDELLTKAIETSKQLSASAGPARTKGAQLVLKMMALTGSRIATGAAPGEGRSDAEVQALNSEGMKFIRDYLNAVSNPPEVIAGNAESQKAYDEYMTSLENYNAYAEHMLSASEKNTKLSFHQIYLELDKYDAGARQRQRDCEG